MARYEVTLKDRTVEVVDQADAYAQEGQMTTFFATSAERAVIDAWSTRVASFRTSEILIVRRLDDAHEALAAPVAAPRPLTGPVGALGLRSA